MISPSLSQAVCAEVAAQAHELTDGGDDFPGLAMFDRFHETIVLSIEIDEVGWVTDDFRISCKILFQGIPDTGIDHDFLTSVPLLLFDPKSSSDLLLVIQEMLNL